MNDPQPEGYMASHIARQKFLATLLGGARQQQRRHVKAERLRLEAGDALELRRHGHESGYQ